MLAFFKKEWPVIFLLTAMVTFMGFRAMNCPSGQCGFFLPPVSTTGQAVQYDVAPMQVQTLDNRTFQLGGETEHLVIVNFWKLNCAPCLAEFSMFESIQDEFGARGVRIVSIPLENDMEAVRQHIEALGGEFTYTQADEKMLSAFTAFNSVPATFLITPQGQVVHEFLGQVNEDVLRKRLVELL